MKILFSGHHNPHFLTITEYIESAIRNLGHELFIFEDCNHLIPGRIRERVPFLNQLDLGIINKKILALAESVNPDIAIVTGGQRISSETISILKSRGIVCILWTTDPPPVSPQYFQSIMNAAPFYDHIFCQGTEAIELFDNAGIKGAQWLPMACDPDYHSPAECSFSDKEKYGSDLVFVGSYYPERAIIFEAISEFDLAIWGPGWESLRSDSPLRRCIRGAHTTPAEWLKIYSTSKVILATHYHDPENRFPVYQASPRVFEALACGAFVICDDQRDVFSLFQDGEDLVRFLDASDLINKAKYYLAHPEERNKIAERGSRNALKNHTYIHRIKELLSKIGNR
jgi:spore maturation protein CgeB